MNEMKYAGFWVRVLACIVDMVILWIPTSLYSWTIGWMLDPGVSTAFNFIQSILIYILYYGLLESSEKQATFGKQLLNLRVCSVEGNRISFARAVGRYLGMYLSALLFCVGFLMVAWTKKKQGLHDMLADCVVVEVDRVVEPVGTLELSQETNPIS